MSPGERWACTAEQLRAGYDVLTGDMLLARCGYIYTCGLRLRSASMRL